MLEKKNYIQSLLERSAPLQTADDPASRAALQQERADKLKKTLAAVCRFQAIVKGIQFRAKFFEIKISKLSAAQQLQNFIRRGLAYRESRRRRRLLKVQEAQREERETDLMRDAEAETVFY